MLFEGCLKLNVLLRACPFRGAILQFYLFQWANNLFCAVKVAGSLWKLRAKKKAGSCQKHHFNFTIPTFRAKLLNCKLIYSYCSAGSLPHFDRTFRKSCRNRMLLRMQLVKGKSIKNSHFLSRTSLFRTFSN